MKTKDVDKFIVVELYDDEHEYPWSVTLSVYHNPNTPQEVGGFFETIAIFKDVEQAREYAKYMATKHGFTYRDYTDAD